MAEQLQIDEAALSAQAQTKPEDMPIDRIDMSDPSLYQHDLHEPFFARLRDEAPVHYLEHSPFGPFWSITRFADIQAVDKNHAVYSSEPTILLGDQPEDFTFVNFIQSDPPLHDEQRKAVQNAVAPQAIVFDQ